jgi:hypothetical protein
MAGLAPVSAGATGAVTEGSTTTAAACHLSVGSLNAGGEPVRQELTATVPPSITPTWVTKGVYSVAPKLSSYFTYEPYDPGAAPGGYAEGWVVVNDTMYESDYHLDGNGQLVGQPIFKLLGSGWATYTAFEESQYQSGTFYRRNEYGLRGDGILFRWTVDTKGVWHASGSYAGFASVKSMALISKTRTYDTFLANLKGGALYTIHIPTTSPLKPVVKRVRSSTWSGFESLLAQKCGSSGTLLLGIDKDTKSAYLYAVGHANGTATVIQSRGKVPGSFSDPTYFRWGLVPDFDQFNGE